ncbi:uncharacterized protein SPAPADRAFT_56457 [Spathaspora passalidarum NRRL Y-27907]|uniref:PCI domain-containing protein n=1 Tax=Spathaspora passalidarum (strain NRRL Y-27907 / 11-Y1) TaxID=619300 RepID=G3AQZ1_SPAPN|nr:uncharacterized protein SPAPADRAFT_56457 [Spathaspora passalidarum NRRL Y-27907]EGW31653.1 hypothetical protein SPAPADRAFT_56457 [Spathaspora passalidarum NRRL Y-27907]
MPLTSDKFDIGFLDVNQLASTFTKFNSFQNKNAHQQERTVIALRALELMDTYQAIHPCGHDMISHLKYFGVKSKYSAVWAREVERQSEEVLTVGKDKSSNIHKESVDSMNPEECHELFDFIKKCVIILLIERKYSEAHYFLNSYATVVQFSTQPKSADELKNNRYVEYLFLQYSANVFQTIWFPVDEQTGNSSLDKVISSSSFKPLETIYKKISTYYSKNEAVFSTRQNEGNYDELHYYWMIKMLYMAMLFKQFKFIEFYDEFYSLFLNYESKIQVSGLNPLQFLIKGDSILKSNLLLMFGIVSIFLKPACSLSFMNDDIIIDLFNENESSLEFLFYNQVLIPLSRRDLFTVQTTLHDQLFLDRLYAYLENSLPTGAASKYSPTHTFIEYMWKIIDFKNFLVIMSVTKQITRTRVIELLGYDLADSEVVNQVSNNLIVLISALGLGNGGIQYLASSELFIHTSPNKTAESVELQEDIEELNNEVKGMTLSSMMTSILIEKFFS